VRWIGIDKFLEFRSGQFARAVKDLRPSEELPYDHEAGAHVMPTSRIVEGLVQTSGILVSEVGGVAEKVVPAKPPRAEIFGDAVAGDRLVDEVTLTDLRTESAVVDARAFRNGELRTDVEIVFDRLDGPR
jgi:3-hydroxyacyl-[acyl-carrier-protein] dehydratase